MNTAELINRHERLLHALKGKVQTLKNKRWIDTNYKKAPVTEREAVEVQIEQTEAEITEHRRTLKNLYQTI